MARCLSVAVDFGLTELVPQLLAAPAVYQGCLQPVGPPGTVAADQVRLS